jgi:signal transduction histidine kinase
MFAIAGALVLLMGLLGALQYIWLGQISRAERERMKASVAAQATTFALDFDREVTLAYLLFQLDPSESGDDLPARLSARYDRWQSSARHPRLVKDYYVARVDRDVRLQRFDPATRRVGDAEWPEALRGLATHLSAAHQEPREGSFFMRATPSIWDEVPALVVPMPRIIMSERFDRLDGRGLHQMRVAPSFAYAVLLLDRDYIVREMLPALAQQHFRSTAESLDYRVAVLRAADDGIVYRSEEGFAPRADAGADVTAELFQVRPQEFARMVAEVRRFTTTLPLPPGAVPGSVATTIVRSLGAPPTQDAAARPGRGASPGEPDRLTVREGPLTILLQETPAGEKHAAATEFAAAFSRTGPASGRWRLMVTHPSGSLEAAVTSVRRRNLLISTSILAILGASMALLVRSARRSQEVARQQMEFVAAVSHELRTPLAVIRSAGDNLAEGVVDDLAQARKYGDLVRSEGRRLSEMVEQILEFSGMQSGGRRFEPQPVAVRPLLESVADACGALIDAAAISIEYDIPDDLPPVLGEVAGLRRVFQNLLGNAIKYGGAGRWIGLRARAAGDEIRITVADRGIGIAPGDRARIFEPFYRAADVVAAQTQGAGLGLSLVARIVEVHGGRITVESTPGAGSEFTVFLPSAAGPRAAVGESAGDPGAHPADSASAVRPGLP